jgi:pimeloyl-ACP methyl ester carboxylesterase
LLLIPIILVVIYFAGPRPSTPAYSKEMPVAPSDPAGLETYIQANEAAHKLKPDNQARIVWAGDTGSDKHVTEYSLVYLHGFSASQGEGDPVHRDIARKFGCNLYLSRLAEHGIDTEEAMANLTADEWWQSAKQALAIGNQLGKKVILIGTSTGGTAALQLAAAYPDKVAALILLSPNIAINDPNAWLLNNHWGLQLAHLVVGSNYIDSKQDYGPLYRRYWYSHYRAEGAVALQELLETTMNKKTFEKVKQPVELLYYYKDQIHQDSTVKVSAMLKMFDELGTPPGLKYKQAIPNAGTHVIGSAIRSHDVGGVEKAIGKFMTEIIQLKPADKSSRAGGAEK